MILKDLAPTLIETREVISILLKELEALQSTLKMKDKELALKGKVVDSREVREVQEGATCLCAKKLSKFD